VAEQREHGQEERVRDQHGRKHAECAADAELRDEVEPEEGETRHRDRDRQAREEHCAAGRCTGFGRRFPGG
jgi:hypothetical protein